MSFGPYLYLPSSVWFCNYSITNTSQVFDGHGGTDAALFVRNNILKFIIEDPCFPMCLEKALKSAFLKADYAFADDSSIDISSGTTALTALMFGRYRSSVYCFRFSCLNYFLEQCNTVAEGKI